MQDLYDSSEAPDPESDHEYILDSERPLGFLSGWVDHERILSSLKANGRQYKKELLDSRPEHWETSRGLFTEFKVSSVLGNSLGTCYPIPVT
jgi:hypothetical protein